MDDKRLISIGLDEVQFQIQAEHDFGWLRKVGKVFRVFDHQDSGCLSFGIQSDRGRLFLKYAGARPINYRGEPSHAVAELKQAVARYEVLHHPNLVELLDHFPIADGYAAVFGWFDGVVLNSPDYPAPRKYTDPVSPYYQFRRLSLARRLDCLDHIFDFHEHVEQRCYVAVDLYDGSVLYDFEHHITKICDIDCYRPRPFFNHMGRLWGSSRFMSPEEFTLGAEIDQRTNVFNLGAMAFCLVGGDRDRSYTKWEAGDALFQIALRAITPERDRRFSSVAEFQREWSRTRRQAGL
ncbi:MAG: serine/threonine protein kinase [Bacillota bacterium]